MSQALKPLCLIHCWFPFSHFPFSGVIRNWQWSVWKSRVGKISEQNWLNKLQMLQFECPKHSNICVLSIIGWFPFSHFPLSGVIRNWQSPLWKSKVGKFFEQDWLNWLQMVQYECPRHENICVLSIVGWFPYSHFPLSGLIRNWQSPLWKSKVGKIFEQNWLNWLQMVHFECPRHANICVLSIVGWYPFSHFPFSGVIRNWQCPVWKSKVGKFFEQNWLKRLQMVQFECPRHSNICVPSIVGWFPFSHFPLSGVIRNWQSPVWKSKVGKIFEQNWLKRLQMVQFECPRHSNICVLSIVGWFPFSHFPFSGVIRNWQSPVWKSKVGKLSKLNLLNRLIMVQFECTWHWSPLPHPFYIKNSSWNCDLRY